MSESPQPLTRGFYWFVGQALPAIYGFVWRVWAGGTSFYIKPRWSGLSSVKISLHGPDPRPGLTPVYKLDQDHSAPTASYQIDTPGFLPCTFPGRDVGYGLTHVVRIAVPADTFTHPATRYGPPTGGVGVGMKGGYISIPKPGHFACVDLYLSPGPAKWPGRARVEEQDALACDLANDSGQHLVGINAHLDEDKTPVPELLRTYDASRDETEVTRGFSSALDPSGYVWMCERIMSEEKLRSAPRTS